MWEDALVGLITNVEHGNFYFIFYNKLFQYKVISQNTYIRDEKKVNNNN